MSVYTEICCLKKSNYLVRNIILQSYNQEINRGDAYYIQLVEKQFNFWNTISPHCIGSVVRVILLFVSPL